MNPKATTKKITFLLKIDADGEFAVAKEEDELTEYWENNIEEVGPTRILRFELNIPLPMAQLVTADIPEEKHIPINLKVSG